MNELKRNLKDANLSRIAYFIIFLFSILFSYFQYDDINDKHSLKKNGKIVVVTAKGYSCPNKSCSILVTYKGKTYSVSVLYSTARRTEIGDKLKVLYDPVKDRMYVKAFNTTVSLMDRLGQLFWFSVGVGSILMGIKHNKKYVALKYRPKKPWL